MTSNAVGGMSNNASGQIQESWSVPETMVDGITERLRKAIITGAIRPGRGSASVIWSESSASVIFQSAKRYDDYNRKASSRYRRVERLLPLA